MGELKLFLGILGAGLSLWQSKEARKYIDKKLKLEKELYEEDNKDPSERDDAVIDNLKFELRQLGWAFIAEAGKPHVADK